MERNIYYPLSDELPTRYCEIGDNNGPCDEKASWGCLYHGGLQKPIWMCDAHQAEAERQEREQTGIETA